MGRIIKNGIVYGGCTFGFHPIIYSTEEREVGVWLDGKPLYQKSLPVTNTAGSYSVNIASLSADAVIRIDIYLHNNTGGDYVCGTYYESNYDKLNYYFTSNKQYVVIRAGQTYSIGSGYITIYYTKTTDTAGSGTWTPQGVPAVHYSTSEQIVGTWIDGSTLYEKTIDFGEDISISSSGWTTTSATVTNIGAFINCYGHHSDGSFQGSFLAYANSNALQLQATRNSTTYVRYVTLRYTKSS